MVEQLTVCLHVLPPVLELAVGGPGVGVGTLVQGVAELATPLEMTETFISLSCSEVRLTLFLNYEREISCFSGPAAREGGRRGGGRNQVFFQELFSTIRHICCR